jgi:predicted TIM-barrel fold metal-dependent hydrolase
VLDALQRLGPQFVGVTQLPASVSDDELLALDKAGVRAIRFNIKRGGSEDIGRLEYFARRVYEIAKWHVELYLDSKDLPDLCDTLKSLPSFSIDHLGLSRVGFPHLLKLVEKGALVKATGFGRGDLNIKEAILALYSANPDALIFGTDLPSTRANRPYHHDDLLLIYEVLGEAGAKRVSFDNAVNFYRPIIDNTPHTYYPI